MIEKASSHANDYRAGIRNAIRGYWRGAIDLQQFQDAMADAIDRGQRFAFQEGAAECGVLPGEFTEAEEAKIQDAILYEMQWIPGLAEAIRLGSKANGGKLAPLFSRAEIWIGRYEGLKAAARAMACGDKKLKWVRGPTSDSCGSCVKLEGKVKRASYWQEKGILPRVHGAHYLECKGFRCLCTLEPTDEPMSKGPLPSLP